MNQSGNWRKKDSTNDSPNNNNFKRSKSMKQRSSNSGSPRTNRGNRDHRRSESGNEVTQKDIQYVHSQTGNYYPDVEVDNLLRSCSITETIKILNDRYNNSYSSKVTGHTIDEEELKEKNKKTNGSSKKQNTSQTGHKETQQTTHKETQQTQQTTHKETGNTQQNTHKETGHTQQNTQQTTHKETGHKETGHSQQTSRKETGHSQQTGHSQPPPREDDSLTIDDFKVLERTLTEKQLLLTNQNQHG